MNSFTQCINAADVKVTVSHLLVLLFLFRSLKVEFFCSVGSPSGMSFEVYVLKIKMLHSTQPFFFSFSFWVLGPGMICILFFVEE